MMTYRMISRVFVVAAVASIGNACFASESEANKPHKHAAKSILYNNKATMAAIALGTALPEDADAAKAMLDTTGVFLDQASIHGLHHVNPNILAGNLIVNFAARKAGRCLAANGYALPEADPKSPVGAHFGMSARAAVVAAAPQVIATLAAMALVGK